jgi:hypothetical protein
VIGRRWQLSRAFPWKCLHFPCQTPLFDQTAVFLLLFPGIETRYFFG